MLLLNLSLSMIGGRTDMVSTTLLILSGAHVGPAQFRDYHIAWWPSIWGPIFVPAGIAILCTIRLLRYPSFFARRCG